MAKYFVQKYLITLLVVSCLKYDTTEAEMDQVEFLLQEQNWQRMTWFTDVRTHVGLLDKTDLSAVKDTYERVDKLKIIRLLLACGFGQKLIDSLWLTTYTVSACTKLSVFDDKECWKSLETYLKKCDYTINKLLLVFEQIASLDPGLKMDDFPFHHQLLAIKTFLNDEQVPSVGNGLSGSEVMWFNQNFEDTANSIGSVLDTVCVPKHSIVKKGELKRVYAELTNAYKTQKRINNLHDLYVFKLESAIDFIAENMIYIGFHYSPEKNKVAYTVPSSSAAAYEYVNSLKQKNK